MTVKINDLLTGYFYFFFYYFFQVIEGPDKKYK